MNLQNLGADGALLKTFEPYAQRGLMLARVACSERDRYDLLTAAGSVEAEPAGTLYFRSAGAADFPVTGDWVAARPAGQGYAIVEAVLPRRTLFSRRAPGRRADQQPIAANIDVVFVVCGLDGDFNVRRLERYLTVAAESGAAPVVVLNKADLRQDVNRAVAEAVVVSRDAPVIPVAAVLPGGADPLLAFPGPGRTVALLGSSGAGKSTIANRLLGEEHFRTGEVRASDSRGRHTTSRRELVLLPGGGALIDTPGMRELQLWAGEESVESAFGEIAALARECRFRDCRHGGEQGCAVAAALDAGRLDPRRLESYRKLRAEARRHELLTDPLAALEQKRRWKQIHKQQKQLYKFRE